MMISNDRYEKAMRNTTIGGAVILFCITALSCVSSFTIYRSGFGDMPFIFQQALALFAVVVVEGAFVWLVYGFTGSFSSRRERGISFISIWVLAAVMMANIVTHFMMVKGIMLNEFQQAWLEWGAVSVFIGVLVIVLAITLSNPAIRLTMLELRVWGAQQETLLKAKKGSLKSQRVQAAMAKRAGIEAERLARRIEEGSAGGELDVGDAKGEIRGDHLWRRTDRGWQLERNSSARYQ
jgi:hypothetical protein